ncbi:antibiotic biosynthesis monooxygenase [bacterium]|jgi:quinol monooxygenase YgiN|nr:antibiotic biosynthesis monooxygenase [bacterium]
METLRVIAKVVALPKQTEKVKTILSEMVEPSRNEKGCLQYYFVQHETNKNEFVFVEEWESREILEKHFETEHFQVAGEKLEGLLEKEPEIGKYFLVKQEN